MLRAAQFVGKELPILIRTIVSPEAGALVKKNTFVKVRRNALRVGNQTGDLVQVGIRWPALFRELAKKTKARSSSTRASTRGAAQSTGKSAARTDEALAMARRLVDVLVGDALTVAFMHVETAAGEKVALVAGGKDYAVRMKELVETAQTTTERGMANTLRRVVPSGDLVSFFYVPVVALLEQGLRVAERLKAVPQTVGETVRQALPPPGKDVPVAGWVKATADQISGELNISSELVEMATRLVLRLQQ